MQLLIKLGFTVCITLFTCNLLFSQKSQRKAQERILPSTGLQDRQYWSNLLYKIAYPVIHRLAEGSLKKNMPLEKGHDYYLNVQKVTYMEAVGRTMAGIAPWLALPDEDTEEGRMRKKIRDELLMGLPNVVNPEHADFLNFRTEQQPIVDAAFIAQAFLRAPKQLWEPLDSLTKQRFVFEFKALRTRKPPYNNWLLFSGITEAFLYKIGEQGDPFKMDIAFRKMKEWYIGDGWYKDGDKFAEDYYNSYVIHSMLVDMLSVMVEMKMASLADYEEALKRMVRYAEFQERIISPEGTYPPIGRSITYRTAAFQALSQISLMERLPEYINPAQVRCALTKVMHNLFDADGTFSSDGWLQLGLAGHQPEVADQYTSTGSLYICTTGFLALGLPATNIFWTAPYAEWTSKKAWSGKLLRKDYKVDY